MAAAKEPPKCRGCNAPIAFIKTKAGKWMPINLDAKKTPHWTTCPNAAEFRQKVERAKQEKAAGTTSYTARPRGGR